MCSESPVPKHPIINKFFTVPRSDYYQLMNNIIAVGPGPIVTIVLYIIYTLLLQCVYHLTCAICAL